MIKFSCYMSVWVGFALCELVFAADSAPVTFSDSVAWLEAEAHRVIRASKRTMKDGTAAFPPQVGIGYEAFWLRDYEYTLEGSIGVYSDKELIDACKLFVKSLRADGAGVDCVKFDGTPIYKPGFGTMGIHPVADGSQFTIAVAWHTYQKTQNKKLLEEIIDPLVKTMKAIPRNPDNGLVHIDPGQEWDRCPYGFTDTVHKQGDVLFCSLLSVQAGRQLSDLLDAAGRQEEAVKWIKDSECVASSIRKVFWDSQVGLFRAATVCCKEHDIWGSAFAVYLGVADADQSKAVSQYFKTHYAQIVQHGQIRHLPGGIYWEQARQRDAYQNGAYWATPTGWFVYTLDQVDPALADRTIIDMVNHFKKYGACEWIFNEKRTLPNYLASASLPLAGIYAMLERRHGTSLKPANITASAPVMVDTISDTGILQLQYSRNTVFQKIEVIERPRYDQDWSSDWLVLNLLGQSDQIVADYEFEAAYIRFRLDIVDLDADDIPELVLIKRNGRGTGPGEHSLTIYRLHEGILSNAVSFPYSDGYGPGVSWTYNVEYIDTDGNGTTDLRLELSYDPDDGNSLNAPEVIPKDKIKLVRYNRNSSPVVEIK